MEKSKWLYKQPRCPLLCLGSLHRVSLPSHGWSHLVLLPALALRFSKEVRAMKISSHISNWSCPHYKSFLTLAIFIAQFPLFFSPHEACFWIQFGINLKELSQVPICAVKVKARLQWDTYTHSSTAFVSGVYLLVCFWIPLYIFHCRGCGMSMGYMGGQKKILSNFLCWSLSCCL